MDNVTIGGWTDLHLMDGQSDYWLMDRVTIRRWTELLLLGGQCDYWQMDSVTITSMDSVTFGWMD